MDGGQARSQEALHERILDRSSVSTVPAASFDDRVQPMYAMEG